MTERWEDRHDPEGDRIEAQERSDRVAEKNDPHAHPDHVFGDRPTFTGRGSLSGAAAPAGGDLPPCPNCGAPAEMSCQPFCIAEAVS